MIHILAQFFIKDHENYQDIKVRQRYGMLCGILGIILNVLLFIGKVLAGMVSGSIAIIADAFNNLSDAGASIISFLGFKLSMQEPDKDHPFGHGRIEYIAGLMVACAILFMSFELVQSSIQKIIEPTKIMLNQGIIIILVSSIIIKLYMAYYNSKIAQNIKSAAMKATALDSMSDCIATSVVLISTLLGSYYDINLDGYSGIIVGIFVFFAGINAAKDTISPLLGQPPSKEFVNSIYYMIMKYEEQGVLGVHDLIVHDYGPGRVMISVHVEVPASGDILELHNMIDKIEHELKSKLRCEAVIHMDPVSEDDELISSLKGQVKDILSAIDVQIKFHDFRVVPGPEQTNLIFDIVIPFSYKLTDQEIVNKIELEVQQINSRYHCIIEVDKEYIKNIES